MLINKYCLIFGNLKTRCIFGETNKRMDFKNEIARRVSDILNDDFDGVPIPELIEWLLMAQEKGFTHVEFSADDYEQVSYIEMYAYNAKP